jgi:hypothetical protein
VNLNYLIFDFELSVSIARKINAKPLSCYQNAIKVMNVAKDLELKNAFYVEGIAISKKGIPPNIPADHAWIRIANKIIDPTYCLFGFDLKTQYFSAIEYSSNELEDQQKKYVEKNGVDKWKYPLWKYGEVSRIQKDKILAFYNKRKDLSILV